MNNYWNISQDKQENISSFKSYFDFIEEQIEHQNNLNASEKSEIDSTCFMKIPYATNGYGDTLLEIFENKLQQTQNQIVIIFDSFYKVLFEENSLLLKELVNTLYLLTDSSKNLFEGKIFVCLKMLMSFQESIIHLKLQEITTKYTKIVETVRLLSMQALYNVQYQNRTKKSKKKQSFSSRVLELQKSYSPCLSIDKESMSQIDNDLLKTIKCEISSKNLQQFLKAYSISENEIVSGSQICRICLNKVNNADLKYHVKKCSQKYQTDKQLEDTRNEIIGLKQSIKSRQMQINNEISKMKDDQNSDGKYFVILHILRCLLRDIDKRSHRNYFMNTKQAGLATKEIQTLLLEDQQLIEQELLLKRYLDLLRQEKQLKSNILKLQHQNLKGSQTDSKRSKFSEKRSLDSFQIKTPQKKNKKSRFAAVKQQDDETEKPNCFFSEKGKKFPLVRKHSSEKLIHNHQQALQFKNFEVLKLLGKGAFGRVYLVRRIMTRDLYAVKVIPIDSSQYTLIKNQHDIFAKISGGSFVKAVFSFTQGNLHMFFLEYMNGGDFAQLLEREVYLEQTPSKYYFASIAIAISKLHEIGIIHRDIKPSNIVLDSAGYLKVTDFGLSKFGINHIVKHSKEICEAKQAEQEMMQQQVASPAPSLTKKKSMHKKHLLGEHIEEKKRIIGTPDYIAPEIIKQQSFDNPSIDWWSYGVIIYEALIGVKPFGAQKVEDVFDNILNLKIIWPQIGNQQGMMSAQAQDLIQKLLEPDYTKRLGYNGIEEIKTHKFWSGFNWSNVESMIPPIKIPSEDYSLMQQNIELKKQIYTMINKQTKLSSYKRLKSLVRLDVLSEVTLSRASISSNQNKRKARKSCFAHLRQ